MKNLLPKLSFAFVFTFSMSAFGGCNDYNYAEIHLQGEILLKAPADLPKGAGTHRNPQEKHAFLKLDRPICMAAGKNSYENAEDNQVEMTLFSLKGVDFNQYNGKRVAVNGVLMHSFVSDAHTALQLSVKKIAEISN
ncbi:MAG: DUF4431 domain-containing protein [Burkholderiaceae bacterium]|nr:DUF4431 domain-containing protein [Burkholderiaceae bacterium]